MVAKEASKLAKDYVADLFRDDSVTNIGLEELEYDVPSRCWRVTVGFSRPWTELDPAPFSAVEALLSPSKRVRDMKVVLLQDGDGKVLSVKNRE